MNQSPRNYDERTPAPPHPPWADWLLAGPGPIAFGLTAIVLAPLALTWTGKTWLGLVVLAGGGLFWWTIMWVGRHVFAPRAVLIVPIMILMALALGRPLASDPVEFFRHRMGSPDETAQQQTLDLDRETAMVAAQKLLVVLLLAVPLYHAMWIGRWAGTWFRLAMITGAAGLLAMTLLQIGLFEKTTGPANPLERAGLALFTPMSPQHVSAMLTGLGAWLTATVLASLGAWSLERQDHVEGDWAADLRSPHLMLAGLAGLVLLATAATLLAVCLAGQSQTGWSPWRQTAPWLGLSAGLLLGLLAGRREFRLLGLGLVLAGLTATVVLWPGHAVRVSLDRGGVFGWSGWCEHPLEFPGVLWLLEWRGLVGVALLAGAVAIAGGTQVRALARQADPVARLAAGGAMVGSWVIVGGWLIGPAYVSGPAAYVALGLWALSLGSPTRRLRHGPSLYLFCLLAVVVAAYGLVGLTPMAHNPLWIMVDDPRADKVLHAIWGLYVTLVCCLGLAPLGRWLAVIAGTILSLGLYAIAVSIELHIARHPDWLDAAAQAGGSLVVALGLLLVPYPWPVWRRGELSEALS